MLRQSDTTINLDALRHNLTVVRQYAPQQHIIAMVKANGYGCGVEKVAPVMSEQVWAFGVACLEEALFIRKLGIGRDCVLMEGVISAEELRTVADEQMQLVIHTPWQLELLLNTPLSRPLKVWIKADSGMHRLGYSAETVPDVYTALQSCQWVASPPGLMSHFACADTPENPYNTEQLRCFEAIRRQLSDIDMISMANSAAIISNPQSHYDCIRPGLMLYGASPLANVSAQELNLRPVMHFCARVLAINDLPAGAPIGYGGIWQSQRPSKIAVITAGYGDGYPRHVQPGTLVSLAGQHAPIVGNVSMDMITVDITDCRDININDPVELWGTDISVEYVAQQAGTTPYELLCQYQTRATR